MNQKMKQLKQKKDKIKKKNKFIHQKIHLWKELEDFKNKHKIKHFKILKQEEL